MLFYAAADDIAGDLIAENLIRADGYERSGVGSLDTVHPP